MLLRAITVCLSLLAGESYASVIDFESLVDGAQVDGAYPSVTVINATVLTAGISLNEFEFPPRSGVNVILDNGGPIRFEFATPVLSFGVYLTYLTGITMEAFDTAGISLGSVSSMFTNNLALSGELGSQPNEFLRLSAPSIAAVTITGDGGGFSFVADDVAFQAEQTPVPEPGTMSFILCGTALLFLRIRRWGSARRHATQMLALLPLCCGLVFGAPSVGPLGVQPAGIVAGVATTVLVTASIPDPTVISSGVNLLRVDSTGRTLAILGLLRDDGTSGDASAGDKVFSIRITLTEANPGQVFVRVSAPFQGMLQRVLSAILPINVVAGQQLPPDPATVAPTVSSAPFTDLASSTSFLYTGASPIQTGVVAGAIDRPRAAVIRGRVTSRTGAVLNGVKVSILGKLEFGSTLSRADGYYDMAVNGGETLVLQYEKTGYLNAQRHVTTNYQDFTVLENVVLIQPDAKVSQIDLSAPFIFQVARANPVSDKDGPRQTTLLFANGTTATMRMPDGTTRPLSGPLSVRATEYTVGASGPQAMPGALPPSSAYTYAVELAVDQATAAGARSVEFSKPVLHYVENFVRFPVGVDVPTGYYDRARAAWIPSHNGRVIGVLRVADGLAVLDVDGSGLPMNATQRAALGISTEEERQIAQLYSPGQSLWRVPIPHFSPWDCNFPYGPPDDSEDPPEDDDADQPTEEPDCETGSIVECQTRTLVEWFPIAGTSQRLVYRSDSAPFRSHRRRIKLTGSRVPASVTEVVLQVHVAGRVFQQRFPAPVPPNLYTTFVWDGKDVYGRTVQGERTAKVRVAFLYPGVYLTPDGLLRAFARFGSNSARTGGGGGGGGGGGIADMRVEISIWRDREIRIGTADPRAVGLGGWTLSSHHSYDPGSLTLRYGYGAVRSLRTQASVGTAISTVAGGGTRSVSLSGPATQAALEFAQAVVVAPDGGLYIADRGRILRMSRDGLLTVVAGTGQSGFAGDGGPALNAQFNNPRSLALGPDGSIYVADMGNFRIRKITPDGKITTIAGNGHPTDSVISNDGQLATAGPLYAPEAIAVDEQGNVFVNWSSFVRRISPSGIIDTIAGKPGPHTFSGDGGLAIDANFGHIKGLAFAPDGALIVLDYGNFRVRRIGPDGIVRTIAGTGSRVGGHNGDNGPAIGARLDTPIRIAVARDGSVYLIDTRVVRRFVIGGQISTVAGKQDGFCVFTTVESCGDGGPGPAAAFGQLTDLAVRADGALFISEAINYRVRKLAPALPGLFVGDPVVPSENADVVHAFSADGRHLRTVHGLTAATLQSFQYDAEARLASVTDGDGNTIRIERNTAGQPTGLVGPFGQRTTLTVDANGNLQTAVNPAGETFRLSTDAGGMLRTFTDPKGNVHTFDYDVQGYLISDRNSGGGSLTLTRTADKFSHEVTVTTAMGRTTKYRVEKMPEMPGRFFEAYRQISTDKAGLRTEAVFWGDASRTLQSPNGTQSTLLLKPDPRWKMLTPIRNSTVRMPGGQTLSTATTRTATMSDPTNPLSVISLTDKVTVNTRSFLRTYTAATRTSEITTPEGRNVRTVIDALGRITEQQVGGFAPVRNTYDANGRLSSVSRQHNGEVRTTTLVYSGPWLASVTDPLGQITQFTQDAAGRPITERTPDGSTVGIGYDPNGNISGLTPPGRLPHTYTYTPVDLPSAYVAPSVPGGGTNRTQYAYNPDRQLTALTRPDGLEIGSQFDTAGRIKELGVAAGKYGLSYDAAKGTLASISDPYGGILQHAWNGGLPQSETRAGTLSGSVSRTYSNDFNLVRLVKNGREVTFDYDKDGLLVRAGNLSIARDSATGMVRGAQLGAVADAISYNGFGELESYVATNGAALLTAVYTRDKLGRVTQKNETVQGVTTIYRYEYWPSGRLRAVSQNGAPTEIYSYDANGNRSRPGETAVYDAQDRLVQLGIAAFVYSANGELRSRTDASSTWNYSYDELGNLRSVTRPGMALIEYVTDGKNRRVGKKVGGVLKKSWIYQDGLRIAAEIDEIGVFTQFVYASNSTVPAYMIRGGVEYRLIGDHLGSIRLVVNSSTGAVAQRIDYDAFGRVTLDTNPGFQPFGFAAGLYDVDTGLVRFGARDYGPAVGRWTAKDPMGLSRRATNAFSYLGQDPVNAVDPSGLIDVFVFGAREHGTPWPGIAVSGEAIALAGYSSSDGFYAGQILAGGVHVGTSHTNAALFVGVEQVGSHPPEPIWLVEGNLGPGIIVAGCSVGAGSFETYKGDIGSYFHANLSLFGQELSVGFGLGLFNRFELARDFNSFLNFFIPYGILH